MESIEKYIQEKEKLFVEWKQLKHHKNEVFVEDGVVCPEIWFSNKIRPLFLLKEAYGGNINWSLTDELTKDGKIVKLWKTVSIWTKGLLKTTEKYIEKYDDKDTEFRKFNNEYLKSIAVINVKKSKGESNSKRDIIQNYAELDAILLKRQLKICDPTIIICGFTIQPLNKILDYDIKQFKNENLFYHIELNGHDVLVLDYWHPSNQFPAIMNYYGLVNIYQQGLLDKNNYCI